MTSLTMVAAFVWMPLFDTSHAAILEEEEMGRGRCAGLLGARLLWSELTCNRETGMFELVRFGSTTARYPGEYPTHYVLRRLPEGLGPLRQRCLPVRCRGPFDGAVRIGGLRGL